MLYKNISIFYIFFFSFVEKIFDKIDLELKIRFLKTLMKFFISYRFTGLSLEYLFNLIDPVYKLFENGGNDVFCNLYKDKYYIDNSYGTKDIMQDCFSELKTSDVMVCLVDTNEVSCGMLLEVGFALSNNKNIIICSRQGCEIDTLSKMANKNIIYKTYEELKEKLEKYIEEI